MRDLAGLLLLYFGEEWKEEQATSHARQPWHLSRLTFIIFTIFFFPGILMETWYSGYWHTPFYSDSSTYCTIWESKEKRIFPMCWSFQYFPVYSPSGFSPPPVWPLPGKAGPPGNRPFKKEIQVGPLPGNSLRRKTAFRLKYPHISDIYWIWMK